MKTKSLIVFTVIALALLVSACAPAASSQDAPTLSVSGNGESFLAPDIAYIYVGVHTEAPTAAEAVDENTAQTEELISAIQDFGVDPKDIRTSNFSIWPMDRYDPATGAPTGEKTYVADNTVFVTVRDLDSLGDLLDTAVQAGANTVNSVQFDVENKDEAMKEARVDAMNNAEQQAQELAAAAGLTLGEIKSISFVDNQYPVFDGKGGGGGVAAEAAAAVPIQPGQLSFVATVNVTYELQ